MREMLIMITLEQQICLLYLLHVYPRPKPLGFFQIQSRKRLWACLDLAIEYSVSAAHKIND